MRPAPGNGVRMGSLFAREGTPVVRGILYVYLLQKRGRYEESAADRVSTFRIFKAKFPFSIGRHCHRPGDFPPDQYHVREFYKIVYFFHGEGEYLVDGRCYPIQPGTVILAHPRFETTYRILGASLDVCNILFLPEFIRENLAKLKNRSGFFSIFNEAEPTMSGLYVFPA